MRSLIMGSQIQDPYQQYHSCGRPYLRIAGPRDPNSLIPSGQGDMKELLGEGHLIEIVAHGHIGHHK